MDPITLPADLAASLDARGWAVLPALLAPDRCADLAALYAADAGFRSEVIMARHGYGRGAYKYFAYPLPSPVAALRSALYPALAPIANAWAVRLGSAVRFPAGHAEFLARCHAAGQVRPTPLLLRYGAGDYNCLHQDLYGEHVFPLQVAVLLDAPGDAFDGGEFILTEQRPRMQSRAEVVPLGRGDAVVFAVNHRPSPAAAAITAPSCATASAPSAAGRAARLASSSTMRSRVGAGRRNACRLHHVVARCSGDGETEFLASEQDGDP